MTEKINNFVGNILKELDIKIINSNGPIAPYEIKLPDLNFQSDCSCPVRFGKTITKKVTGNGIINGKAVIAKLPSGVVGTLIPKFTQISPYNWSAFGHVTILIEVSENYVLQRYKQLTGQTNDFVDRVKKNHFDIVEKLAEYAEKILYAEYQNVTVYNNGLFENKGDCQGNGIYFEKLGMKNLNTSQECHALAIAITDILNTNPKKKENLYYIEHSYNNFLKQEYVTINVKMNKTKKNLMSW